MAAAVAAVSAGAATDASLAAARTAVSRAIRRVATLRRDDAARAADGVIETEVRADRLVRTADRLRLPGTAEAPPDPARSRPRWTGSSERWPSTAPPPLSEAARAAACPPAGIRELERSGRIAVLGPELAYAMSTYRDLAARALAMCAARAAHARRLPRCDRDEPQVRDGDPRGPRPARHPASNRRRPCPGTEGARCEGYEPEAPGGEGPRRPRLGVTRGPSVAGHRAGRRPVVAVRSRQARRAARGPARCSITRSTRSGRSPWTSSSSSRPTRIARSRPGVRTVHDERAFEGPLAGVAAGLAATTADIVIVVAGDMPTVVPEVLAHLVRCLATTGADVAVLAAGDDRPPLPMALRRAPATTAVHDLLAAGERRLRALPARHADGDRRRDRVATRRPGRASPRRRRRAGRPARTVPDTRRPPPEGSEVVVLGGRKVEAEGGVSPGTDSLRASGGSSSSRRSRSRP